MMWLARLVVRWSLCLRRARGTETFRAGFIEGVRYMQDVSGRTPPASPEQHYRYWLQD